MIDMVLDGIRVIDWTQFVAGPSVGCRLASLGADVIHIEPPKIGDGCRFNKRAPGRAVESQWLDEVGHSAQFEYWNYNKRGLTVDLKKEKGREIIYRLVKISDIFLNNQLPDTVEKLGLAYEVLSKINPRLIFASANILGVKGPYRLTPGWDTLGQAASGVLMTTGWRHDVPTQATSNTCDFSAESGLEFGIMAALFYREKTGKGQRVDTSQLQGAMNGPVASYLGLNLFKGGDEIRPNRREEAENPIGNTYKCKDERWIFLGAGILEKHWITLTKTVGHPELADDSKFNSLEKRAENNIELVCLLDDIFAEKTADEWMEAFKGIDFPFYPCNRLSDLRNDPQVIANNCLFTFDHPRLGRIQYPGMTFTLSETPGTVRFGAPGLGEHNDAVLYELGYSQQEIDQLRTEEVI